MLSVSYCVARHCRDTTARCSLRLYRLILTARQTDIYIVYCICTSIHNKSIMEMKTELFFEMKKMNRKIQHKQ